MANNKVDEATRKPSRVWIWLRRTIKSILIFTLGLVFGAGIISRGDDGLAFFWTFAWIGFIFALLEAIFLNGLRSPSAWWKSLPKTTSKEEVSNDITDLELDNTNPSSVQPTDPDDVETKKLSVAVDDPSKEPAYQLGQRDFQAGKGPREATLFPSRKEYKTYMIGYSAAMYDEHLTPEGGKDA